MIVIKGIPKFEKEALEATGFIRKVTYNQPILFDDMLYDITLKSHIQIITKKYGIELFTENGPVYNHYMDETLFTEVIIT